jgi:2-phospho-L-lactate/phosphoenolpyruvate guanylyltransferase
VWHALVPVKSWNAAKSRLAVADADRSALAQAMTIDTVAAVASSPVIERVTVVVSKRHMVHSPALREAHQVVCQPDIEWDVNDAIRWAIDDQQLSGRPTVVLLGDLPSLRGSSLTPLVDGLLDSAGPHRQVFASDRHGVGTTMLAASRGADLTPRFGPSSANQHRASGAIELRDASADVRCDVDTLDDLALAVELGVGRATAAEIARLRPSLPWPA